MIAFAVTGFEGHWLVDTAAIAYGRDREEAKRALRGRLLARGLGKDNPDDWTLEPLTPAPDHPHAYILLDGNY